MDVLIESSPMTIRWLNTIKSKIKETIPSLIYGESEHYASFKSPDTNRNVVYLRPYKTLIQLFTRLPLSFNNQLQPSRTSSGWRMYPSKFTIRFEDEIGKAIYLIDNSYQYDLSR